jgi:ABC-type nitrate/sulfonate/bicarbonate transport system permease component
MNNNKDSANELLKAAKEQLAEHPFKTIFKATLGFYAAQFVATLLGLAVIGTVLVVGALILKVLLRG